MVTSGVRAQVILFQSLMPLCKRTVSSPGGGGGAWHRWRRRPRRRLIVIYGIYYFSLPFLNILDIFYLDLDIFCYDYCFFLLILFCFWFLVFLFGVPVIFVLARARPQAHWEASYRSAAGTLSHTTCFSFCLKNNKIRTVRKNPPDSTVILCKGQS